jgi:hypothetical protein
VNLRGRIDRLEREAMLRRAVRFLPSEYHQRAADAVRGLPVEALADRSIRPGRRVSNAELVLHRTILRALPREFVEALSAEFDRQQEGGAG